MSDRKRTKKTIIQAPDSNPSVEIINVAPGTVFRLIPNTKLDGDTDTKEGKDLTRTINRLKKEILTLEDEKVKLSKAIETATKRRKTTISSSLAEVRDKIALEKDTLEKLKANIAREYTNLGDIARTLIRREAKLAECKEWHIKNEREYTANMDRMRKDMNSQILVAKNKVTNYEKQFERMQSQYKKMELDINESHKEKEKLRRMNEDFSKMDETLNRRSKMITDMEEDLQKKKQYFDAGQKEYQNRYEEREKFYSDKVAEYNKNITKLAKDQKDLVENWDSLRKEGARLGVSDRNKKRIG